MLGRYSLAALLLVLLASLVPRPALAAGDSRLLAVPYRSQFDGNPYEESDCGPASMAMVLGAFGKVVPTRELRNRVNDLQGTHGIYDAGTLIENLGAIGRTYGLRPDGLMNPNGKGFRRWTLDELRRRLDAGQPVIPQVWYRGLPGRENRPYNGDHYMVITGYVGDDFYYNDPVDRDGPGARRRISTAQLDKAWRNSDFPYAAVAFAGPTDRPAVPTATPPPVTYGVLRPVVAAGAVPNLASVAVAPPAPTATPMTAPEAAATALAAVVAPPTQVSAVVSVWIAPSPTATVSARPTPPDARAAREAAEAQSSDGLLALVWGTMGLSLLVSGALFLPGLRVRTDA